MNPTEPSTALDAVVAQAKVNKIDKHARWLLNGIFTLLLVTTVTFSALGYLRITSLIATQNKRSMSNQQLLQTIQADDKILKTATGPGTVAASVKQVHCIINRLDYDTGRAVLDKTCPSF